MRLSIGPFILDTQTRSLRRGDLVIPLTSKEMDTLIALVSARGEPVETDHLLRTIWGGTNVVVNNLARRVSDLRRKLGKNESGQDYILTLPGRGYVLAAAVKELEEPPPATYPRSEGLEAFESDYIAAEPGGTNDLENGHRNPPGIPSRMPRARWLRLVPLAAGLSLACCLAAWLIADTPIRVLSFVQLTNDGLQKGGPLLTDGRNIYFEASVNGRWSPVAVPANGGDVVPVDIPLESPHILDISPEHPEFLISGGNRGGQECLWSWIPGHAPKPLALSDAKAATWLTQEGAFADTAGWKLRVFDGRNMKAVQTSGNALFPRSASDGRLRFTVWDPKSESRSIWETRVKDKAPRYLTGQPASSCCGNWTPGLSFFVFQAGEPSNAQIWATHDTFPAFLHRHAQPFSLTSGPISYSWPTPNPDGRTVFAIGSAERGTLVVRRNEAEGFKPYLGGISGRELDWAPDGHSVAYVSVPDDTLWTMDPEGQHRSPLTKAPLKVAGPHWSPDGSRIAFMGHSPGGDSRVYVIAASGGLPTEVVKRHQGDEGVPTWQDGSHLLFGELQNRQPATQMEIRTVDLRTGGTNRFGNRTGLWTPRVSYDGRWVVAMTPDFRVLMLYDVAKCSWSEIARMRSIDDPTWTGDSRYVHFRALDDSIPANETILALYRVDINSRKIEKLVTLRDFVPALSTAWFGVTPDGSPIGMWDSSFQEIYALHLK